MRAHTHTGLTSFCPLRPFLDCPSPVKSSFNASTATVSLLSRCIPPRTLSDKRAMGDISEALKNGIGTVLPAAYMDQSCKWHRHWNIGYQAPTFSHRNNQFLRLLKEVKKSKMGTSKTKDQNPTAWKVSYVTNKWYYRQKEEASHPECQVNKS